MKGNTETKAATRWSFHISSNKDVGVSDQNPAAAAVSFCHGIKKRLENGVNRVGVWRSRRKLDDWAAVGSNSSEARRGDRRSPFVTRSGEILRSMQRHWKGYRNTAAAAYGRDAVSVSSAAEAVWCRAPPVQSENVFRAIIELDLQLEAKPFPAPLMWPRPPSLGPRPSSLWPRPPSLWPRPPSF